MVPEVYLVGVGLGNPQTLTGEARAAIAASGLVLGAPRLVEAFANGPAPVRALVRAADIEAALRASEARVASVLFSGDVGFYSGAAAVSARLADVPGVRVRAIPGISSLSYLCARLLVPWHDAFPASAHGRACDPAAVVAAHAKAFFLLGGAMGAGAVCAALSAAGLGGVEVHVGERLSYADERISHGTAAELAGRDFDGLAAMLVLNPDVPALPVGEVTAR